MKHLLLIFTLCLAIFITTLHCKDDRSYRYRFRARRDRPPTRTDQRQSIFFNEDEFRTEVIVPVMNVMGLGLSVFGNLYPVRQLRNDDGTPMNDTELKSFRTQMNAFHSRFFELGRSLTGVIEQTRALKNPFNTLGRKIALTRQLQMAERNLKEP